MKALAAVLMLALAACSQPREPVIDCSPAADARPVCGFKNPEDLALLPGTSTLVISQMGRGDMSGASGSLVFFDLTNDAISPAYPTESASDPTATPGWGDAACTEPPGKKLAPHGISLAKRPDGALALYVVNHGREAIELFEVDASEPGLEWRGCVPAPDGIFLNDVAALPDGGFVTTHMFPRGGTYMALFKGMIGLTTGVVLEWHPGASFTEVPGSAGAMPNGIETSPDGEAIYVDMYLGNEVRKIARKTGEQLATVEIASPDNVLWSPDGTLLVASHNAPIREVMACGELEHGSCPFHYSIVALDPETLEPKALYENAGPPMGAGTAAIKVGDELIIGSFAGDRIVRVKLGEWTKKP
jgi:hypothetical protein